MANRSPLLTLALALGLLLSTLPRVQAQIVDAKPGRVKAANRRALRETKATESPYKDSHLGVTRDRLKRGQSTQPQPITNKELEYKKGTAPNVKPIGFLGLGHKKKKR